MQDSVIIKTLRKAPDAGMELLMEQYAGLVYSVVKGKLLIPPFTLEDIEDCVADTFIEFYYGLSKFDPETGSIKAWLCTIARTNAIDRVRKQYAAPCAASLEEVPHLADGRSQEEEFLCREEQDRLLDAIQALGDPDREIILRKFYLHQSSKEIAKVLGLTVSNVDTRTHRAIAKLRKHWR